MRIQACLAFSFGLLFSTAAALPEANPDFELDNEFDPEYAHLNEVIARDPCHPKGAHVIAASGAGPTVHNLGLLASLAHDIVHKIPGATLSSVPFPKEKASYNASDPLAAITKGTKNMRRYIRKFHKRCKHTPIVLIGYSSGAVMTSSNICGGTGVGKLPKKYHKAVAAAIMYGDETFVSGQSWDAGTCKTGQGVHPRNPATCAYFAPKMRSYCDAPDPDCCGGDNTNAHFLYPKKYNKGATGFAHKKVKEWHHKHGKK